MKPGATITYRPTKPRHVQPGDILIDDRFPPRREYVHVTIVQSNKWRRYWIDVISDDGLSNYSIPARASDMLKVVA